MNFQEILERSLFALIIIAIFLISDEFLEVPSDFGEWFDFDEGLKVNSAVNNKRLP